MSALELSGVDASGSYPVRYYHLQPSVALHFKGGLERRVGWEVTEY